jgi:type I restriction enzyme S subunit
MASIVAAWPTVALGEVVTQISRSESVQTDKEYRLLGIRLDGNGPFLREVKVGGQISATSLSRVEAGDFIYSRLFAWRGAFGVIDPLLDGCYVSGEFPTFQPCPDRLDTEFLRLWFRLPSTLAAVEADCTGSTPLTRNRFKEHFFLAMQIPLPPLDEQRRIVARIEALAVRIEQARGLHCDALADCEGLIRSSYSTAWSRAEQSARLQMLEEYANVIDPQPDHRTPPEIPGGWPYVSIANIRPNGNVDVIGARKVDISVIEKQEADFTLCSGDIVLGKIGTIGAARPLQIEQRIALSANVVLVQPSRNKIIDRLLLILLRSPQLEAQFAGETRTTAQGAFGIKKMRRLLLPVPSMAIQTAIVSSFEEIQSRVDTLKQLQAETQAELDALLPSILDQAFRGEL